MSRNEISLSTLTAVIVTMHPDIAILEKQIASIPKKIKIIVVDNASQESSQKKVESLLKNRDGVQIINNKNLGLATAINQGCEKAKKLGFNMVLLLDQDSEPEKGSIEILLRIYKELLAKNKKVGCVGPRLIDVTTNTDHGFHRIEGLKWKRIFLRDNDLPMEISSLNGSGTLMSLALHTELGGLEDSFFIDHVDTEWSFRVMSTGYSLYGVPQAVFNHRMGDKSFRFWLFGWKVWPWRSPLRHRYLFRNAVSLMRRSYVPFVWKFWAVIKLIMTLCVHLIVDSQRLDQVKSMLIGGYKGVKNQL